jgi:hypothetical protein
LDDTLREWAEALRSIANELDSVADQVQEGIYVSPEDIERLTAGQMIPNVVEAPSVRSIDTDPIMVNRPDCIYHMRGEHRKEQHVVTNVIRHIEDDLARGLTVRMEYDNGKRFWFRPGDKVELPPW